MKQPTLFRLSVLALLILASTQGAIAHENHVYRIGDKTYQFTVGSLNEPVAIDDKTGLDFRVEMPGRPGVAATPVTGLDQTLKVEIGAGGKKKVFNLQPSFGQMGAYRTAFYPTVQTTLIYRIFGTVDNIPVDFTYTCNPAGHPRSPDDNTEVKMSDQVTRLSRRGAFGCPGAKADMGFPEPAPSLYELQTKVSDLDASLADARAQAGTARAIGFAGVVVGLLGLAFGASAFLTGKKRQTEPVMANRSGRRSG